VTGQAGATWGVIPAAGVGSRIQPLACSKELLPLGSRIERAMERPRAVSEYLIDRMLLAGANRLCFVISPGKSDILGYYGAQLGEAHVSYVVQPRPAGLCDAIFRAAPLIHAEDVVLVGLPDTVWFPEDGFRQLAACARDLLGFLLFPVSQPQLFDAVVTDDANAVREIQVKHAQAKTPWVWGAIHMPGRVLHELYALWQQPGRGDEYVGTLVNAYLARGGRAAVSRAGEAYVDVGTFDGYRRAIHLLDARRGRDQEPT
jgi:glucose-1-phosphate thymidylyltransferase